MNDTFSPLAMICIFAFVSSSMFSVGTSLKMGELLSHMRNVRLIVSSFIASFILVPLSAVIISTLLFLDEPYRIGLILFSMTAGTEALPTLARRVKGNEAYAVTLMIAQILISMVAVPVIVTLASPEVNIAMSALLLKLSLIVFFPLVAGLFIKARWSKVAPKLHRVFHLISNIFIAIVLVLVLFHGYAKVVSVFGSRALLAGFILFSAAALIGYFLGGPAIEIRKVLSLGSCGRNISIALLVASQAFSDPKVAIMVVVMSIAMLITFLPVMVILNRVGFKERLQKYH